MQCKGKERMGNFDIIQRLMQNYLPMGSGWGQVY